MANNILNILIFLLICQEARGLAVIKNVVCTTIDPKFSQFDVCEVKPNTKKIPALSVYVRILQLPVTNCQMHLEILHLRKTQPLVLANATFDACVFMENRKKYRSLDRLFKTVIDFTNVNHTCPYDHDVIISNLTVDMPVVPLPLAKGLYLFKTSYLFANETKLSFDVTGSYE